MSIVLHGLTAYEYWRSSIATPPGLNSLDHEALARGKVFGARLSDSLDEVAKQLLNTDGAPGNLHVLVDDRNKRRWNKGVVSHTWHANGPLPPGSLVQIGSGVMSVGPELCLIQIAQFLTRLQLLRAITDLCARYSVSYDIRRDLIEREPVTSIESISAFLRQIPGTIGATAVSKALRWCVENTRSPRETTMDLYFRLSARLGGKQLPAFEANRRLPLSNQAALLTKRGYLEGDIVWFDNKLVVEYNSDKFHDSEEEMEFDFEKITALQAMGTMVIPISTWQFNDYDRLEAVVTVIRERLRSGTKARGGRTGAPAAREARSRATHKELLDEERRQRELPPLGDTARWRHLLTQM